MAYSYSEILQRMKNTFRTLTGKEADECSDIGIRLKLLAGEIYSMGTYADWLKKQMFFTTASGEQLDNHAAQRGLVRKLGQKAEGIIVFRTNVSMEYDMEIPAGTVCTTADGSLNYLTLETVTIRRGRDYTYAPAQAEYSGIRYNVGPRKVNTIVTYFSVGLNIENSSEFYGGTDDESDDELRERIADSLRFIANGANEKYYQTAAESVDGVQSAYVYMGNPSSRTVNVVIGGRGVTCSAQTAGEVYSALSRVKCVGISLNILPAVTTNYSVNVQISVKSGYVSDTVKADVRQAVTNYFQSLRVHQDVLIAEIGRVILNVDGVKNYTFSNMADASISEIQLAVLDNITVGDI